MAIGQLIDRRCRLTQLSTYCILTPIASCQLAQEDAVTGDPHILTLTHDDLSVFDKHSRCGWKAKIQSFQPCGGRVGVYVAGQPF